MGARLVQLLYNDLCSLRDKLDRKSVEVYCTTFLDHCANVLYHCKQSYNVVRLLCKIFMSQDNNFNLLYCTTVSWVTADFGGLDCILVSHIFTFIHASRAQNCLTILVLSLLNKQLAGNIWRRNEQKMIKQETLLQIVSSFMITSNVITRGPDLSMISPGAIMIVRPHHAELSPHITYYCSQ